MSEPDSPTQQELENELHVRMTRLFREIVAVTHGSYSPTTMRNMVADRGGFEAVCHLVRHHGGTDGFHRLITENAPELTAEFIALIGPWSGIIPEDVCQIARERLVEAGVELPE
jgi:hypothetical protein